MAAQEDGPTPQATPQEEDAYHPMTTPTCSTCNSTEGFYDGPNGVPRCSKCFHDQDPSPSGPAKDKAEDAPKNVMTTEGTVQDKAVRGPKEQARK